MSSVETTIFTHEVVGSGPASGMKFTGREWIGAYSGADVPLLVALHGGGYTSAYFDVPDYSLIRRAAQLGVPIVAIDRPGYGGSSAVPDGDSVLVQNARVLDHLIAEIWAAKGQGTTGVVLIGHSIGSAIALEIASRQPDWPLLGVAVSGFLLEAPHGDIAAFAALPDLTILEIPNEYKAGLMFGPSWTRPDDMPEASYAANAPLVKAEMIEVISTYLDLAPGVAAAITVPMHIRQGEFDERYVSDATHVAEFASAFTAAPCVDARLALGGGHVIDYSRCGFAFQIEQLAFALTCATIQWRATRSPTT